MTFCGSTKLTEKFMFKQLDKLIAVSETESPTQANMRKMNPTPAGPAKAQRDVRSISTTSAMPIPPAMCSACLHFTGGLERLTNVTQTDKMAV